MKQIFVYTLLVFLFFSCNEDADFASNQEAFKMEEERMPGYAAGNAKIQSSFSKPEGMTSRKVIWNANLEFQITNVDEATSNIKAIANKYNAFVSNMHLSSINDLISRTITLRVKSEKFDSLISSIKGQSIYI